MIAYNIPGIQEIILRLGVATVVGGTIGLNRDLHGKPAGLRTHALVTLGAALLALTSLQISTTLGGSVSDSLSRVIQGIVTGIGFLGAGVIIRNQAGHVHGLTTAATIWVAASLGVVCGVGYWLAVAVAVVLVFLILMFGGPVERSLERVTGRSKKGSPMDSQRAPPV